MPTREEIEIAQETLLDDNAPIGSIMPSEDLDVRQMTLDYIDQQNKYKSFVGIITQSGTSDPVFVLVHNDISTSYTISRLGVGSYSLIMTGAFANTNKCIGFPTQQVLAGSTSANINDFSMFRQTANNFRILTRTNAASSDNLLSDFPIEIRVYN